MSMFNPYTSEKDWPAGVVRDGDCNDVPPECRLHSRIILDDVPFREESDELSVLHELYVRGSLRRVRVA